jgi:hypothetical protein
LRSQIVPRDCSVDVWHGAIRVLAALQNSGAEGRSAVGRVTGEVCVDGVSACAFAKDCDFARIAAEGVDVALDPGERKALVEESEVAFCQRKLRGAWKAKHYGLLDKEDEDGREVTIRAVVCSHNDDVFVGCEGRAIGNWLACHCVQ